MFERTAPTKGELITALARDYKAASQRQAELMSERAAVLAQPFSTKEIVTVYRAIIDRARNRFKSELERRIGEIMEPWFDPENPDMLGAVDPLRIIGTHGPEIPWNDAILAVYGDAVLKHIEAIASALGGDKSKWTLKSRQAAIAKLDAQISEHETAASRALNQWRAATGQLTGYPPD